VRTRVQGRFAAFPDFELEAYLCAELPVERRMAVEHERARDAGLGAYLLERERERGKFAAAHPLRFDPLAVRAEPPARALPRWLLWAGAAAPAFALALWWTSGASDATGRDASSGDRGPAAVERDTIRIKGGGIAAELYVKRGERVFRPRPDEPLKPGDRVRLSVEAASAGYLSVLARDERGAVSVYYDRLPVRPGRFTVPDSLLLDASTSDELWLVVLADEPHAADHYAQAFAAGKPPAAAHALLTLRKEKP
jgi:hypothetical protein